MMPRFLSALLLLAGLLLSPAQAQNASLPPAWVIRDADTEITLFPTIHALPPEVRWLSPAVTRRFDTADMLVLETVLPEDRFELAPLIQQLGIDPELPPLARRLSPAGAEAVTAAAAAHGIPMPSLDRMQPWLAAITLAEASLSAIGINAGNGVEPALMARAKSMNREIVALETPAQQLGLFAGLPQADQVAMLEATVADIATARADSSRLVSLWQRGDMDSIAAEFAREARASPRLTEVLLTARNRRWAEWLASEMASRPGRLFVAVGAGHFGGPDGLLALLAARGFKAQRVPASPPPAPTRRRR